MNPTGDIGLAPFGKGRARGGGIGLEFIILGLSLEGYKMFLHFIFEGCGNAARSRGMIRFVLKSNCRGVLRPPRDRANLCNRENRTWSKASNFVHAHVFFQLNSGGFVSAHFALNSAVTLNRVWQTSLARLPLRVTGCTAQAKKPCIISKPLASLQLARDLEYNRLQSKC